MANVSALGEKSNLPPPLGWRARAWRSLPVGVAYLIVYYLLDWASASFADYTLNGISLWYAPAGLSMAVLLRFGASYAPFYFVAALMGNISIWYDKLELTPLTCVALSLLPASIYGFCVWVLRRYLHIDQQLVQLRSGAAFVIGVGVAALLVSCGSIAILSMAHHARQANIGHEILDFWIGDVVAQLSIAPFLLTIVFPWWAGIARIMREHNALARFGRAMRRLVPRLASTVLWLLVLVPTIAFCLNESANSQRAVLYPCFLPLIFAAYWRGIKGASAGAFIVSMSFALFADPPNGHYGLHDIQLFLITLCLTTLLLGSAITSFTFATNDLQQIHDVYRQAIVAANSVPYVRDYELDTFTYIGEGIESLTGFTAKEFTTHLWEERSRAIVMHGQAAGVSAQEAIRRTRSGEFQTWSSEGKFLARDGTLRWVADASVEIGGEGGRPVRSIGLLQDITRLKEAEEALRQSRAVLTLFVQHAPAAVAMFDREMRYLVASRRWYQDYRLTDQDIIGKCHYDVFPEIRHRKEWIEIHKRCLAGAVEKREEDRFERADGSVDWLRWEVRPWYDENNRIGGVIMFTEVVTERKLAEEALRKGEERLELALGGADLGLWDLEIADARLTVNPRFAAIFDYTAENVPTNAELWYSRIHPDDAPVVIEHTWGHIARDRPNLDAEFRMFTNSGRQIWVHLRGKVVEWDSGGVPQRVTGTLQDITARKKAEDERRALEEQMQQTQKLESLGILAGGIAHDFNNLLVGILGNADLALADAQPGTPLSESLEAIVTSSQRAAELCRQMLAYSGRGRFVVAPLSLNELVDEMRQLLSVTVSKRVALTFNPARELPLVRADATQIRQIIMNLITNASEAVGDMEGVVRMSTGWVVWTDHESASPVFGGELREGETYVFVRVEDTGAGMDHATLQRIFDPFFTTKFTGRGLGLAAVLGIVRGHHGAIRVESTPGQGTTFTVYLPALDENAAATPPAAPSAPVNHGTGVVLVVDDEEPVLAIARTMLERKGYRALTARDGAEALALFEKQKDQIVLAIVDLTMPRMGGGELIHALHAIKPGLRVVLSSGYNEQEAIAQSHGEDMAGFIQKPYRAAQFYEVIQSALNGEPSAKTT